MNDSKKTDTKTFVLTALTYGVPLGIFFALQALIQLRNPELSIIIGIVLGALSGSLFAFLTRLFTKRQSQKFDEDRKKILKKNRIVYEASANRVKGKTTMGGWLFLTTNGLSFKPHKYNLDIHELWISHKDIASITVHKSLGFLKNGLIIEQKNGDKNRLLVNQPDVWIEKIKEFRKDL